MPRAKIALHGLQHKSLGERSAQNCRGEHFLRTPQVQGAADIVARMHWAVQMNTMLHELVFFFFGSSQ